MKIIFLLIFLVFCQTGLFAQELSKPIRDFSTIDSFARTVKFKRDIYNLTHALTDHLKDPLSKSRAIFIWITENIKYDYKFYNSGKTIKIPECKPGVDCNKLLKDWENKYLLKTIRKEKAICNGYATLLNKMCEIAGIKTEIITGYTKTRPYQVGNAGTINHAWNAICLDTTWFLLDPTWAAGYCYESPDDSKLIGFKKSYSDYYWLTPYKDFHRNHFPEKGKWAFEPNYTKEKFAAYPWIDGTKIPAVQIISPQPGVLDFKTGDTIKFKIEYQLPINKIQINTNIAVNPTIWDIDKGKRGYVIKQDSFALKRQQYIEYKRENNTYFFDYVVSDASMYYLEILFDYHKIIRFKAKIRD